MCDTFVYPQPKLKPILITPPSSPAASPAITRQPSESADPPPRKDFLSRLPSVRRSNLSRSADRRPSLPNLASTSDEASDLRVLREGHEREQEKIAWAAAARKGSVSRAASQLGRGSTGGSRKLSGSGMTPTKGGDLGQSTNASSNMRGPKTSFDFLTKPPDRSGRSSAPLATTAKSHSPRKAVSQNDLRGFEPTSPSDGGQPFGGVSGSPRKPTAALARLFAPPPTSEGNPHPFLGRPLPSSNSLASVVDIRPDGLWEGAGEPSSSSQGHADQDEPTRYEIGQAISPDPPAETTSSSQSSSSTQRTHRRYASQASRSISSLDAFHARFPPSPISASGSGPALKPDGQRRAHGRASTISPGTTQTILPGLASAPALLDTHRSPFRESQEESSQQARKVASSSSMRVHPSTSGSVHLGPAVEWTFPSSPGQTPTTSHTTGAFPERSPNPMQAQHARGGSGSFSRPLVPENRDGSQYAMRTSQAGEGSGQGGGALFHYENYEVSLPVYACNVFPLLTCLFSPRQGLFFEPPQTPIIRAPPPSSYGGDDDSVAASEDDDDDHRHRGPLVVRNVSVTSPTHSSHQEGRYSVQSITGEMGDLSAADFPRPPPPQMTGESDVASFFTAASRMNSSS